MSTISAAIITFNEERNIRRCILALQKCVDEIVVLDSFSTDRTAEICKELGVKFLQKEWMGYSKAKNFLNEHTTCDYIFSIDADEAPNEELQQEILRIKAQGLNGVYSINRITNYCGKWIHHSGWFPDVKIRIFPKEKAKWAGDLVHEELEYDKELTTSELNGLLEHYSYYSFKEHRQRADKYSLLTATKYAENGKKAGVFKPFLSGVGRFISMYILKKGFLDGKMGFKIAWISAQSNILKYKEVRRLSKEQNKDV